MWRTIIVASGERLRLKDEQLVMERGDHSIAVPVEDIYSIVIENDRLTMTAKVLNALSNHNVHIILCDEKHLPSTLILPLNKHYRAYAVLKKQILMSTQLKNSLWAKIIYSKIDNQARVLSICGCDKKVIGRLEDYRNEVQEADIRNREGLAAKSFFRELYGTDFIRFRDDVINSAQNYGYAIIRGAISKTLVAYGFNCALGIHHIGETNPFNLSEDMMEPFRPIIDFWIASNNEDLHNELSKSNRADLVNLINRAVLLEGKRLTLRYAIDRYIKSFVTALDHNNADLLKMPQLLPFDSIEECEDAQPFYEDYGLF